MRGVVGIGSRSRLRPNRSGAKLGLSLGAFPEPGIYRMARIESSHQPASSLLLLRLPRRHRQDPLQFARGVNCSCVGLHAGHPPVAPSNPDLPHRYFRVLELQILCASIDVSQFNSRCKQGVPGLARIEGTTASDRTPTRQPKACQFIVWSGWFAYARIPPITCPCTSVRR